jgi:hypothetical protein
MTSTALAPSPPLAVLPGSPLPAVFGRRIEDDDGLGTRSRLDPSG